MFVVSVLVAAIASFAAGAAYYMILAKPWMAAANLSDSDVSEGGMAPYAIAAVVQVIVALMMAVYFRNSGITGFGSGLVNGGMIGLLFISPWIFLNTAYSKRSHMLAFIDSGYAVVATAIMGAVLGMML